MLLGKITYVSCVRSQLGPSPGRTRTDRQRTVHLLNSACFRYGGGDGLPSLVLLTSSLFLHWYSQCLHTQALAYSLYTHSLTRSFIHGAKCSAVSSRRCDLSPDRSVSCQLRSISHQYSHVLMDLMNPGSGRSTSSTLPVRWWPDIVLSFGAGPEYLVCWDIIRKYGSKSLHNTHTITPNTNNISSAVYDVVSTWEISETENMQHDRWQRISIPFVYLI